MEKLIELALQLEWQDFLWSGVYTNTNEQNTSKGREI